MPSRARSARPAAGKAKPKAKKATAKRAKPAAEKPAGGPTLQVKQIKSGIGHAATYRRTLRALGLRHHQDQIVVQDNPSIRGMLAKVHHLVSVTAGEK